MALLQKAYLGATPLFRDMSWFENDSLTLLQSAGINITTGGTAHTKGSWTPLIASTSNDASYMLIRFDGLQLSATNTATLVDLGTGASGSETVIVADLAVGGSAQSPTAFIPFKLPSGTRLSARAQGAVASRTFRCDPTLYTDGRFSIAPTSVDVTTADVLTSKGLEFTGASGTWNVAFASTSRAYRGVSIVFSMHDSDIAIVNGIIDVGVGAAGSEVAFGTAQIQWLNSEMVRSANPIPTLFGRGSIIPAGSRLSVRHNIAADPEKYGFTLIGIP